MRALRLMDGVLMLGLILGLNANAESGNEIYKDLLPKTVWVVAEHAAGMSTGTGFVVAKFGANDYIMTNHHVVRDDSSPFAKKGAYLPYVKIYTPEWENGTLVTDRKAYLREKGFTSRVVYSDPSKDLAIVMVPYTSSRRWANGTYGIQSFSSVSPGDRVFTVGNPGAVGGLWAFSSGEVRQITGNGIETTSPINPGDSGGPVVDASGRFVGVNVSFNPNGRLVSHAVSWKDANAVLEVLKDIGYGWKEHMSGSGAEMLIKHYQDIGLNKQAWETCSTYNVGLRGVMSDEQITAKAERLAYAVELTTSLSFVAFRNSSSDTLEVTYGSSAGVQTVTLKPKERVFLGGERPLAVEIFDIEAVNVAGTKKWPKKRVTIEKLEHTLPKFRVYEYGFSN
jgi:hypothetical protein